MVHDFSPIDSEPKYRAALDYLISEGMRLAETVLGQQLIPDTLTIFSRTKAEYDFVASLIRTYGKKSRFTHGITLYIDVDMKVAGNHVVLLGVREPDSDRQDIGYADFPVENYIQLRAANKQYTQEITTSRDQSLLELRHPDFDIRGYLVSDGEHGSFFDELCQATEEYHRKWGSFIETRQDKEFFHSLIPTAVAWKVYDRAELDRCFMDIRDRCNQVHAGWLNDRWLMTLHLKDEALSGNIRLIKLMERRPGSTDPVGLDHLDFHVPRGSSPKAIISKEPNLKWSEEMNGEHCKWLSLWINGTEAKLRANTVLQVCADELLDLERQIVP